MQQKNAPVPARVNSRGWTYRKLEKAAGCFRTPRAFFFFAAGGLALWACHLPLAAQTPEPVPLAPVVTTADRVPESVATVGAAIDVISGADSGREQLTTLADALWGAPGGPLFATGRTGASDSLFLRGANSDQVLFLVDGIRFSDANANYGPFLGSWRTGSSDQVEIARGPQSMLYGAEAVGGVVSLSTPAGTDHPTEALSAEAGSFGTIQGSAAAQGKSSGLAYNAFVAGGATDNDRANNDLRSSNAVVRLDELLSPAVTIGMTVRGLDANYGDPGDRFTNDLTAHEREEDLLGTVFARVKVGPDFSGQLTAGSQYRRFDSDDFGTETVAEEKREVLDGQVTGQLSEHHRVVAGFDWEADHDTDDGFGLIDHRDHLNAVFAEDEVSPVSDVYVTAGLRHDNYSTYGSVTTGRATLAWLVPGHLVKLRGSYGTGFNSPSFLDLYARSAFFVGNPAVQPERSRGGDAGFDLYVPADPSQVLSVTVFRTDFRNLIEDNFNVSPATTVNVDRARTEGLELSWKHTWSDAVKTQVAYTYLHAQDLTTRGELLRRPRQSGSADIFWDGKDGWTFGVGGLYVGRRADVDAQTFATVQDPDYASFRAYARWQLNRHFGLHARVENAFNRSYEPVNGYPALGRGVFGGADWSF